MKDSILKGTGNSRFLKSAIPEGTTWAEALAMLRAGTFPMDLNGINTEGFQQVGTPLNKANLLKDATAAQIGLPSSATPNDMFNALAHAGDLHVWRKTAKNAADVPAGYTITDKTGVGSAVSDSERITISYSDAVDVDDQGKVSLREPITTNTYSVRGLNQLGATNPTYISGKFFTATTYKGVMYRKPSVSWIFGHDDDGTYFRGGFVVKGYAKIFAGTTTTYPVSTNRNAYQEGNDAKPAGYTLGEPKTTVIPIHPGNTIDPFYYGDVNNVAVTDDGVVSVSSGTYVSLSPYNTNNTDSVKGKYIQGYPTGYPVTSVYYIPADATFSNANGELVCDKAQLVTGYAAIPANTTIEYLGCLGDKARVQVVSYVGTGTYGSSNPCSITADFKIKLAMMLGSFDTTYGLFNILANSSANNILITSIIGTEYKQYYGFTDDRYNYPAYGKISEDQKTFSWYGTSSKGNYYNSSSYSYYILVIG